MRRIRSFAASVFVLASLAHPALTADISPVNASLKNEAHAAIDRSVKWLKQNQAEKGNWSNPEFPALTGLALWSLLAHDAADENVRKAAVDFLMSHARENGSIYAEPSKERKGGGLPNYNTAISMVALHMTGDPGTRDVVLRARKYVASGQHFGGDVYKGGFGYDAGTKRAYADLSNTLVAAEAMRLTEDAEDFRPAGEEKAKLNNEELAKFVSRVQNRRESNDAEWVSDDPKDAGGFAYHPENSMAGTFTNQTGKVMFRSYGSMTYAGLLTLIYADVDRSDPRVQSAYDWATKHWTLEENPGMGNQGIYYFYNVLAKGMNAMNQDRILRQDGTVLHWREELVNKLVRLQKINPDGTGFWSNEESRWFEADPVLVTAYTLIALDYALR